MNPELQFLRRLSTMKVLIADDQRNMVTTIENMLISICSFKRKSNSIFRASNGEEVLKALLDQPAGASEHIDLLLLDWNMPKVPGIEVIRAIRSSSLAHIKDIPVIMITGESRARDVSNALYEGVNNYLLKPFLVDDLRTRMNPLLRDYWAGAKLRRAKNRRGDVRYPAELMRMKVEMEFGDGSRHVANVIDVSKSGLKAELANGQRPTNTDVKSLHFPTVGMTGEFVNSVNSLVSLNETPEDIAQPIISVWFKLGFENPETQERWLSWVSEAKNKERAYRSQLV